MSKFTWRCPNHLEHIRILIRREVSKVPLETKQKIIDELRKGRTIGAIGEELNLSLDVVCEIIMQNIEDIPVLRKEAI